MKFNEDSRVKIPTILHLTRLGYEYLSLKNATWKEDTNIFSEIFISSILSINEELTREDAIRLLDEISLMLENEDLGQAFYERLIKRSGIKLIDFENFGNNTFNVVTELTYKKDDEEFRPDIILLINGMPLVFIEVKKPNNREGILKEKDRINKRSRNKKFRKFINITQLMVFSNNMEYDDESSTILQGTFYASSSYTEPVFNYFREEDSGLDKYLAPLNDAVENFVLKDNNLVTKKHSPDFILDKSPNKPTNRICTSLFSKDRLAFILKYSIAYVLEHKGLEKHVMRYPQIFATKAIEQNLEEGVRKGIIWHTQGSGKTALAYFNVRYLIDYFQKKGIVAKFYFIVDRLDLLKQASGEFRSRDLIVHNVNSRDEFAKTIKSAKAIDNDSGKPEITVVNIQKFKDDPNVVRSTDYNLNLQRVYFLDEVHRSYNPKGSFLANLNQSDTNAIKIGLTGTPLLGTDYNSRSLFGDYIHKYYYNQSIADGYTLRLIREDIETSYRIKLTEILEDFDILKGSTNRKKVFADYRFVEPMLDYIIKNFEEERSRQNDASIGAMVVCDSSDQAKEMYSIFQEKYANRNAKVNEPQSLPFAAEPILSYSNKKKQDIRVTTAALILHDIGTKKEREDWVDDFKAGKIDILFVYNMLLTGFNARRLKKLYLGRVIKAHNLLQMLTRVNRTYLDFKFGYVVDFADIRTEFDKTNKAYFDELQSELGDEMQHYSDLFLSQEEIEIQVGEIKDALFHFDTKNASIFSDQITAINDRKQMLEITKALNQAKSLYNLIRLSGHYDLLEKLDFRQLNMLSREANNRLALINTREAMENDLDNTNLLNLALEEVIFAFNKVGQEEMILADQLKTTLRKTREAMAGNMDPLAPEFISLKEELERLFKKKKLSEVGKIEMEENIIALESIYTKARELERKNQLLQAKYENDAKYARIHKRLIEKGDLTKNERQLFEALKDLKEVADNQILQNAKVLENEGFVEKMMIRLIIEQFKKKHNMRLTTETFKFINNLVVKEYINEFHGTRA